VNYNFPNIKLSAYRVQPYGTNHGAAIAPLVNTLPRSTALRSLGGMSNCFANESFMGSWIASLSPGQGGWLGAISDRHIGPALKLIHENPERPWTLSDLGQRVGLGRSVFSARFTKLVGQSVHRYVIERRMAEAAFLLETSDESIARIASGIGYETAAAFSKLFHRYHGLSPGRYREARRSNISERQVGIEKAEVTD
jgi:AraC-like DNA-binding protein